jgi:uncharacterized metal-binding protein YceD (DUF177 family)
MNIGFPGRLIRLDRLSDGPVEWSGPLDADRGVWDLEGVCFAEEPRVVLRIEETGDGAVRLRGQLGVEIEQECRRCLDPARSQVVVDLDLRFDPEIGPEEEAETVYALDPQAAELDLLPALREELVLALPEFPLCREGCRGLCPSCGGNRNAIPCDCRNETTDPRWDALRERFPGNPDAGKSAGDRPDDD